jgi:hypothetical protein
MAYYKRKIAVILDFNLDDLKRNRLFDAINYLSNVSIAEWVVSIRNVNEAIE